MKTITSVALLLFVALASTSALPAPDEDQPRASPESSDASAPAAIEGEELVPDESRWGYGGRRGYGGWGGYGGYGGWGGYGGYGGYGGGWGRGYGGWGRGYGGWGHGGWGR